MTARNIFGKTLIPCCFAPVTGFYRDGYCHTADNDPGNHSVCAQMTAEFLRFSKRQGNDLSTPRPEWGFPGLQPGDRWCLCAERWYEAYQVGVAPPVLLDACDERALEVIPLAALIAYGIAED